MIRDRSVSSRMIDCVTHIVMVLVLLITLLPVIHVAAISLSSSSAINRGLVSFWPVEFSMQSYYKVMEAGTVPRAFLNSALYMAAGTALSMVLTIMMAYPLSKKNLPLRNLYLLISTIPMFFSGGMIPKFLLVNNIGIYNTFWAMILPGAVSTWNLIIMRSFFQSIPESLEESARLDGANDFHILWWVIIPLSLPAIATVGMFYAVSQWNGWFDAMVYLKESVRYPLQLVLREIVIQGQIAKELAAQGIVDDDFKAVTVESIKYATLFISILPMLIIYPFVQKYFVKGVMVGSVKG